MKPQCNTSAECLHEMTPTIEEAERVALDGGAFVAIECVTYSLKDGEIVFTKEQLQAFAQHWIEVGRKEQREIDNQVSDGIYQDRVDDNLALCEALRAVYTICGESKEVEQIVHDALREHGINDC